MSVPANETPLPAVTARAIRSRPGARLGVLDHHDGVGAARHHAAGRDRRRLAGANRRLRDDARVDLFLDELHDARHLFGGAERVFGDDGEAVDVGAIERRDVHRREDVGGENASKRRIERNPFDAARGQVERSPEAALGLVAIEDLKELLLLTHRARRPPRSPRQSLRCRRPRSRSRRRVVVDDSTDAPPTEIGSTRPSTSFTRA